MLLTHDQMRRVKDIAQSATHLHTEDHTYPYLAQAAADVCDARAAFVACLCGNRLRLKAAVGMPVPFTGQPEALWHAAMESTGKVFLVEDAKRIARFATSPLVTGEPAVRFYVSARLIASDGRTMGALCVVDNEPRGLHMVRVTTVEFLARQIATMLEKSGDCAPCQRH